MSEQDTLHAFLRSKATSRAELEEQIDWQARKQEWLTALNDLYGLVKSWLQPLENDGTVRYPPAHITIREDHIGTYKVDVLTILIGKQRIAFHPKGTLIIGADGRVDVRGQRAVRTLILSDGEWVVVERTPQLRTFPFNEDSFQDLLREIME
jgi:hypothetical protein